MSYPDKLTPPPREKSSPVNEQQWREELWRYIKDVSSAVVGASSDIDSGVARYQNELLNGAFEIWQRGTSLSGVNSTRYTADRWRYTAAATTAVFTIARSTDIPTGAQSGWYGGNSLHLDCTTADASIDSTDRYDIGQPIIGYQWARLRDKTVTLSFWVKATVTGTYCVSFANSVGDRSYVAEYTVDAAATWERKTITVTLNPSGGTDNYTNGIGLFVRFAIAGGSNFQTTAGAWQTGNFTCTANQVNGASSTANDFRIAQVQLAVGEVAPVFARQQWSFEAELAACQAYYEKSYDLDTAPGTATALGRIGFIPSTGAFWSSNSRLFVRCSVRKIKAPTCTVHSEAVGTAARVSNQGGVDRTAIFSAVGQTGMELEYTDATASQGIFFQWVSDAEI